MIERLLRRLDDSTCNVMAVETIKNELLSAGFTELLQCEDWSGISPGARHFMIKNNTAIFAFIAGTKSPADAGFRIISAHTDSPCFKIKPNAEIYGEGGVVSLNVEKYGGPIMYTWFDRPLSISGRVALRSEDPLNPIIMAVDLRRPVATIPHLAIHFNRAVNEGNHLSVQKDMKPVVGIFSPEELESFKERGGLVRVMIAEHLGEDPMDILEYELNLYPVESARLSGFNNEFIQSGRIDDLSMAFAGLEALLSPESMNSDTECTRVLALFDNEETGSGTKQGAASPVLAGMLQRICMAYEETSEAFHKAVARTFMISADDAHAWHPNYGEKYDPTNHALMGNGPAIKINANCKYMTDTDGAAVFRALCDEAGVKCQYFVNHGDVMGGSTLGNILTSQLDIRGVDMGNPIWAMHSACETASVDDHESTVKVFTLFYSRD